MWKTPTLTPLGTSAPCAPPPRNTWSPQLLVCSAPWCLPHAGHLAVLTSQRSTGVGEGLLDPPHSEKTKALRGEVSCSWPHAHLGLTPRTLRPQSQASPAAGGCPVGCLPGTGSAGITSYVRFCCTPRRPHDRSSCSLKSAGLCIKAPPALRVPRPQVSWS